MNKKVLVSILAISSGLFVLYKLLKNFNNQKNNRIIPSSSVFSAIKKTQRFYE